MAQLLLDLNLQESIDLERMLNENKYDCSVRPLYDNFVKADERERYAIEGNITNVLLEHLKMQYGNQIKSDLRFA